MPPSKRSASRVWPSMPLTAIGELSSLSTRSGRVATSESSEHKGCLRPARIPRRSQTASLRLNKAQRQRRGACTRFSADCTPHGAPERAPLTGQNDRRAAHVSAVGAARRVRWLEQLRTPGERLPQHINDCRSHINDSMILNGRGAGALPRPRGSSPVHLWVAQATIFSSCRAREQSCSDERVEVQRKPPKRVFGADASGSL